MSQLTLTGFGNVDDTIRKVLFTFPATR